MDDLEGMTPASTGNVTATELAAALITCLEGCRLTAYKDVAGVWTIGVGTTGIVRGEPIKEGMTITMEEAEGLLQARLIPLLPMVAGRPLLEQAALLSFAYNVGPGALKRVLAGQSMITEFSHAGGKEIPGLVARRNLEELLVVASQQITKP